MCVHTYTHIYLKGELTRVNYFLGLSMVCFLPALLRYNWHTLCKFQVFNMLIGYTYITK